MLLAVHHALLREASTIAGVCIPAIIMACYIIWILYSAHRDRRKVTRFLEIWEYHKIFSNSKTHWPNDPDLHTRHQERLLEQTSKNFCHPLLFVRKFVRKLGREVRKSFPNNNFIPDTWDRRDSNNLRLESIRIPKSIKRPKHIEYDYLHFVLLTRFRIPRFIKRTCFEFSKFSGIPIF